MGMKHVAIAGARSVEVDHQAIRLLGGLEEFSRNITGILATSKFCISSMAQVPPFFLLRMLVLQLG
jgi:hypothetical protein